MPSLGEIFRDGRVRSALTVVFLGILSLCAYLDRPLHQPPGILAPNEPIQETAEGLAPWTIQDYRIVPLATFDITARVLAKCRYRFDGIANISPVDLAMGWGPMSDSAIIDQITITQHDRWYFWSVKVFPIPQGEISAHSANMHMIPKDCLVEKVLTGARVGNVLRVRGHLVRVEGANNLRWVSSLTRSDTGDGSCEVVWVDQAEKML